MKSNRIKLKKAKKEVLDVMAMRKTIFALLKGNIEFKIIKLAKDVKEEIKFEHLGFLTEKILEQISKDDLQIVFKDIINFETFKIESFEKLYNFFDSVITVEKIEELLSDYNKSDYTLNKIEEGHKVIFNERD